MHNEVVAKRSGDDGGVSGVLSGDEERRTVTTTAGSADVDNEPAAGALKPADISGATALYGGGNMRPGSAGGMSFTSFGVSSRAALWFVVLLFCSTNFAKPCLAKALSKELATPTLLQTKHDGLYHPCPD